MRKITLFGFFILCSYVSWGQQISSKVLATAGGTLNGGGIEIAYAVGQTFTTSLSSGTAQITQGFEQPDTGQNACPTITSQPTNTILCGTVGSTASMAVTTSFPADSYAWQYRVVTTTNPNPTWITITAANAAVYANYTTAALHITRTATLPAMGTQYRLLINATGCAQLTSAVATITVITTTKTGTITVPSTMVCEGNNLTMTLTGALGTSLQWQSAPTATGTFTNITGATGTTYTLTNAQLNSNKSYRVQVSNACTGLSATTPIKTITVNPPSVAGTIIVGGGAVCSGSGSAVKLSGYTGKIQWEYSTDGTHYNNAPKAADGQTIPFGTSSTTSIAAMYMITNLTSEVYFRARVTSGACSSVYSEPVHYSIATVAIAGNATPYSQTVCPRTATSVSLANATGTVTWERSTNYTAANPTWVTTMSHSLTYNTGNLVYNTAFRAKVSIGDCSTVYSNIVYVYLEPKPIAKNSTANTTTPSGTTAGTALCTSDFSKILTVGNGYTGTLQWQTSTTSTTTGFTDIAGATTQSYTINNPIAGPNYFRVVFTNTCGEAVFGKVITVYYTNCSAKAAFAVGQPTFDAVAYPNPYQENFRLNITTSDNNPIEVTIYDITGKQIENSIYETSEVIHITFGDRYPAGVYTIRVNQGTEQKTVKVIKQ